MRTIGRRYNRHQMTSSNRNLRHVRLEWSGENNLFSGGAEDGPVVIVDGASKEGASPMQLLLLSLAGCMGIDIRLILEKSRVPLRGLIIDVEGERAPDAPRRYVRVDMTCRVDGPSAADADKVQRAVDLSKDKYCSVLHSLDPATDIRVRVQTAGD